MAAAKESGFAPGIEKEFQEAVNSGSLPGLHAVLVSHAGEIVLEQYLSGTDESWADKLGHIDFSADTLHDVRSVTKSIVSLLYGIALDRGLVPSPETKLLAHFPEYPDLQSDAEKQEITIGHVLAMTAGLDWDEDRPYDDPLNSEIAMELSTDRYRYILERPVVAKPGERWIYSGGCVALLGALIERGAGKTLPEFAKETLFEPLGISNFEWLKGQDGVASPASGLRLTARGLLRIGSLILKNGKWDGRQIISESWLNESFTPRVVVGGPMNYGYFWYLCESELPVVPGQKHKWFAAFGNGGQRLWLMPDYDIAVVILAGNYNKPDAHVAPNHVWQKIVLANFRG